MCFGGGDADIEETPLEREQARIAEQKYNYLRPQLQAAEEKWIADIQALNNPGEYKDIARDVSVSQGQQFDRTLAGLGQDMAANQIDPSSGRYQGTLQQVSQAAGRSTSDAVNRGQTMQQDNALSGLSSVVAVGEGESADAIQGSMDVANLSSQRARQNSADASRQQNNRVGTLAYAAGATYETAKGGD